MMLRFLSYRTPEQSCTNSGSLGHTNVPTGIISSWGLQQHPLDIFCLHRNPLLGLQTPPIHSTLMPVNLALNSAERTRGKLRQYCAVLYLPGNFLKKLLKLCLLKELFLALPPPPKTHFRSQNFTLTLLSTSKSPGNCSSSKPACGKIN